MNQRIATRDEFRAPAATKRTWLARMVLARLSALQDGVLELHESGHRHTLGTPAADGLRARLDVHDARFWKAVARHGSIGAGEAYAERAGALLHELDTASPFDESIVAGQSDGDVFPLSRKLRQHLRGLDLWQSLVVEKLRLGSDAMRDLGNLYSAALPAWLASGLRQAADEGLEIGGQSWLALGYGSGDAAEALPMRVAKGWKAAAGRINFAAALGSPVDLTESQYLALHEGHSSDLVPLVAKGEFIVESIGTIDGPDFHNLGVEFYRYVPAAT